MADGSIIINTKGDATGFNNLTKQVNKSLTGIKTALVGVAAAMGIVFGVQAIINFGKASVKATTDLRNAMVGLKSIMDGQGRSFAEAKAFINDYVKDGLIPATQAINAYKNLALRGYDDTQIQQVLIALKDSSAFGRQASYSMGEAVQMATEGLKNENSILVDNAGVTKNVAKMWEDYAKKIGVSTTNLTKQQKIQAEVLGIMEETRFQTGDAAKAAKEYSGQVLALGFNFNNLKIAVGNAILPIAWRVLPALNSIIMALTRVANLAAQVTTALFGKRAAAAETTAKNVGAAANAENDLAKATTKAGKAAKGALAGFDELNVLAKDTAESATATAEDLGIDVVAPGGEIGDDIVVSPEVQAVVDRIRGTIQQIKAAIYDTFGPPFKQIFDTFVAPVFNWFRTNGLPLFQSFTESSKKVFGSLWGYIKEEGIRIWEMIIPAFKLGAQVITDILDILKKLWYEYGVSIMDSLSQALEGLRKLASSWWESTFKPIWETLFSTLTWLWDEHLRGVIEQFGILVAKLIQGALDIYNGFILPIAMWLSKTFGPAFSDVVKLVINVLGTFLAMALDVVKGLLRALGGIIDFLVGVFTGDWEKAWQGIKDIFGGIMDGIVGVFKGGINLIIDLVNYLISKLNTISFSVPEWVPGMGGKSWGINIPSIPKLATGAVIPPNAQFMAILGDQTHGRNIEAPEGLIRQIIQEELENLPTPEVTVVANGSASEIIRFFKFEIDRETRRRGPSLIRGVT